MYIFIRLVAQCKDQQIDDALFLAVALTQHPIRKNMRARMHDANVGLGFTQDMATL
jgi:hypothetical protein